MIPESKAPVDEVTVCATLSVFVQWTVVPSLTEVLDGLKVLPMIDTSVATAPG